MLHCSFFVHIVHVHDLDSLCSIWFQLEQLAPIDQGGISIGYNWKLMGPQLDSMGRTGPIRPWWNFTGFNWILMGH